MTNLFETATVKKTTKKNDNLEIVLDSNNVGKEDSKRYVDVISKYKKLKEQQSEVEAELKIIEADLRETAKKQWAKTCLTSDKNVGSVIIKSTANEGFMFIVKDQYAKIDEAAYTAFVKKYGNEIATTEKTYSFESKILNKYLNEISKAIMSIKNMTDEEKQKLIFAVQTYSITKGSVSKLKNFDITNPKKKIEVPFIEFIEEIQPMFSLKDITVD